MKIVRSGQGVITVTAENDLEAITLDHLFTPEQIAAMLQTKASPAQEKAGLTSGGYIEVIIPLYGEGLDKPPTGTQRGIFSRDLTVINNYLNGLKPEQRLWIGPLGQCPNEITSQFN